MMFYQLRCCWHHENVPSCSYAQWGRLTCWMNNHNHDNWTWRHRKTPNWTVCPVNEKGIFIKFYHTFWMNNALHLGVRDFYKNVFINPFCFTIFSMAKTWQKDFIPSTKHHSPKRNRDLLYTANCKMKNLSKGIRFVVNFVFAVINSRRFFLCGNEFSHILCGNKFT